MGPIHPVWAVAAIHPGWGNRYNLRRKQLLGGLPMFFAYVLALDLCCCSMVQMQHFTSSDLFGRNTPMPDPEQAALIVA